MLDNGFEDCVVGAAEVVESTADVMGGDWAGLVDGSVESVLRLDEPRISGTVVELLGFEDGGGMTIVGEVERGADMLDSRSVVAADVESEWEAFALEDGDDTTVGDFKKADIVVEEV